MLGLGGNFQKLLDRLATSLEFLGLITVNGNMQAEHPRFNVTFNQ